MSMDVDGRYGEGVEEGRTVFLGICLLSVIFLINNVSLFGYFGYATKDPVFVGPTVGSSV